MTNLTDLALFYETTGSFLAQQKHSSEKENVLVSMLAFPAN